jgi:hypothetical protein
MTLKRIDKDYVHPDWFSSPLIRGLFNLIYQLVSYSKKVTSLGTDDERSY